MSVGLMFFPWLPAGQQWTTMYNAARAEDNWDARWRSVEHFATQEEAVAAMVKHNEAALSAAFAAPPLRMLTADQIYRGAPA